MNIEFGKVYSLQDWDSAGNVGGQDRFVALADDKGIWANLGEEFPHPYTRSDAEAWVALQSGREPVEQLAICDATGPIGAIGLITREGRYQHSAALGYWLGRPFWGHGIMTAAAKLVTAYGFETLGLIRLEARVRTCNNASSSVLQKVGFRCEGLLRRAALKQGVPVDYLLYAILETD